MHPNILYVMIVLLTIITQRPSMAFMIKPELLAPVVGKSNDCFCLWCGSIFCGSTVFGLRKYADNFSLDELHEIVTYANHHRKMVYVVLNSFAHEEDIPELINHLKDLNDIQPHAVIVSDVGVAQLVKKHTSLSLHVSTQASVTNRYACEFWKTLGAKRVILAREVSIKDCEHILSHCDVELETLSTVLCAPATLEKCTISNIAAGRDSNRGGCVQSCRHRYEL